MRWHTEPIPSLVCIVIAEGSHELAHLSRAVVANEIHAVLHKSISNRFRTGRTTKHDNFQLTEQIQAFWRLAEELERVWNAV